jgi:hypothetical protein
MFNKILFINKSTMAEIAITGGILAMAWLFAKEDGKYSSCNCNFCHCTFIYK